MTQVIGLGAGGHAKVVIETLRLIGGYEIIGLLDPKQELWGIKVLGVPVLGDDQLLSEIFNQGVCWAFIGLGGVGDLQPRRELFEKVRRQGFQIVSAVHPQAIISPSAKIGHGPTVMASATINAAAHLGENVIVNTGAIIEHDCIIGDHVHIATGAKLAGTVHVEAGAHIGLGASILEGIRVGEDAIVGAGAVVVDDVPERVTVVGIPARILKRKDRSNG